MSVPSDPPPSLGNMPYELIYDVVDVIFDCDPSLAHSQLAKLRLINKHWDFGLKGHKLYTEGVFDFCASFFPNGPFKYDSTVEDVDRWLGDAHRRDKVIRKLDLKLRDRGQLEELCTIIDRNHAHIHFEKFFLFLDTTDRRVQLPISLKAKELIVWGQQCATLDWDSFNDYLRSNVTSIALQGIQHVNIPKKTCFPKLVALAIATTYLTNDYKKILKTHKSITSLCLGPAEKPFNCSLEPISLGTLPKLETLTTDTVKVNFNRKHTNTPALKFLHINENDNLPTSLTGIPDSLETLGITTCALGMYEPANILGKNLFARLATFKKLRQLIIRESFVPLFFKLFNSGYYDDSFPLLDKIELNIFDITVEAFDRFLTKHPRITPDKAFRRCENDPDNENVEEDEIGRRKLDAMPYLMMR